MNKRSFMLCDECGTQNPDTNQFCNNCGKPLKESRMTAPVAQPAPLQVQEKQSVTSPLAPEAVIRQKRTWLGIVSLIPAIFSWIIYPILLGIVAIILGIVSIYIWKKKGTRFPASAVISIIIGLLAVVLNIFWMDIFPPPQILPPVE